MTTDRVIVEILTTANMAGVEAAKGGLLGLNGAMMGITAALALLVAGTKSMIDIAEAHAQAEADLTNAIQDKGGSLTTAQSQLSDFIGTNSDFISSQADVVTSYATLIREGVAQKDVVGLLTTAMNISGAENISMSDAVNMLQSAEAGRTVGLKKLVGVTLEAIPAHDTLAQKQAIVAHNMDIVAAAYKNGTDAVTPLNRSMNDLSNKWQDIANRNGPALVGAIDDVAKHLDILLAKMSDPKTTDDFFNHMDAGMIYWGQLVQDSIQGWADLFGLWQQFIQFVSGMTPSGQNAPGSAGNIPAGAHRVSSSNPNATAGSYVPSNTNSGLNAIGGELAAQTTILQNIHAALTNPGRRGGTQSLDTLANALAARSRYAPGS